MGVGVTTSPADLAMQGARGPRGPSRLPENIFFTVRPCSISNVYGFALFDEIVGTDPLDRARFARNVLDFCACWHMIFWFWNVCFNSKLLLLLLFRNKTVSRGGPCAFFQGGAKIEVTPLSVYNIGLLYELMTLYLKKPLQSNFYFNYLLKIYFVFWPYLNTLTESINFWQI